LTESEKARIIDAIEEVQWWHMIDDGKIMPGAESHEKALCRYADIEAAIRKAIESDKNYVTEDVYDAVYAKKEQAEVSFLLLTRLIIADLQELRSHIVTRPCAHLITKLIKKYEAKWEERN
jgi:hypothetical protein